MQGHRHTANENTWLRWDNPNGGLNNPGVGVAIKNTGLSISTQTESGSYGPPRKGYETSPANLAVSFIIKY